MGNNKEMLTVQEVAQIVGVSAQAVYKRLSTSLKPYSTMVEGKKYIRKEAIKEVFHLTMTEDDSTEVEQPLNDDSTKVDNSIQPSSSITQELIDMLKKELEQKNQQIEKLQELLDQEQKIFAMQQQKYLALEVQSTEQTSELEETKQEVEEAKQEIERLKNRGFWDRLFNN